VSLAWGLGRIRHRVRRALRGRRAWVWSGALLLGLAAFPFAALLGFMIGRYEDAKEDVTDLIP